LLIFQQAAVPPYGLVLARPAGAPRDWPDEAVPVDPTLTQLTPAKAPALRVSTVELNTQHDAKLVTWLKPARLVAWSGQRAALGAYPDAALVFDLQVRQAPDKPVQLAMECEYPCAGTLDLSPFMRRAAGQGTQRVKLPLACFAERGLDLRGVDVPFSLTADAPFSAAFARIRIVAGAARDADAARCADFPPVNAR
jgi:beta-glucosidase